MSEETNDNAALVVLCFFILAMMILSIESCSDVSTRMEQLQQSSH